MGIAGGAEKCAWLLEDCKLDAVIDYKNEDIEQRIGELCPDGVNVFFDNVGGDYAGGRHHPHGRLSGASSCVVPSLPTTTLKQQPGPRNLMILVARRVRMQGFIVLDYLDRAEEAIAALTEWVMAGDIVWREDIQEGFENIPATLQRLFSGRNVGKQLLKLAEPE